MISAIFLIFFLETGTITFYADQTVFTSLEECNQYAEEQKAFNQAQVIAGINAPHRAIHRCVDWGQDV
jgi:hypothetical protein